MGFLPELIHGCLIVLFLVAFLGGNAYLNWRASLAEEQMDREALWRHARRGLVTTLLSLLSGLSLLSTLGHLWPAADPKLFFLVCVLTVSFVHYYGRLAVFARWGPLFQPDRPENRDRYDI
jgi:hypothetical protein